MIRKVAAHEGFEPSQRLSESPVLPLHQRAIGLFLLTSTEGLSIWPVTLNGGKDRNRTDFKRSSNARYNHISYRPKRRFLILREAPTGTRLIYPDEIGT